MSGSSKGQSTGSSRATRVVLVVDDDDATRALIARWLSSADLGVIEARSGDEALATAADPTSQIDAVVLDVMLPGIDGFEVLRRLKANPATEAIPVVMLTAHATGDEDVVRGAESGATDHLVKPFRGPVLVAKVKAMCERSRADRRLKKKLLFAEANATIDALTGLRNRRLFEIRLAEESAHAARHKAPLAIIMIDLDHFKSVNDTYGHEEGDLVLRHFAEAVREVHRSEDSAFRYGGEEFVLLLRDCDAAQGVAVAERLATVLRRRPALLGDKETPRVTTFSAGVAAAEASNDFDVSELVARADAALYRAKREGRDRVVCG